MSAWRWLAALRGAVREGVVHLRLLCQRKVAVFVAADVVLLFFFLLLAVVGEGRPPGLHAAMVVAPTVLLGIPVLSDVLALERRAGSLDLALSSPGARTYFERRVASFCAACFLQGSAVVVATWGAWQSRPFPLIPVLVQVALLCSAVGAVVLFWAVRLRSPGAVAIASYGTSAALYPLLTFSPFPEERGRWVWPLARGHVGHALVLLLTVVLLYLYARRRLARPELVIG